MCAANEKNRMPTGVSGLAGWRRSDARVVVDGDVQILVTGAARLPAVIAMIR